MGTIGYLALNPPDPQVQRREMIASIVSATSVGGAGGLMGGAAAANGAAGSAASDAMSTVRSAIEILWGAATGQGAEQTSPCTLLGQAKEMIGVATSAGAYEGTASGGLRAVAKDLTTAAEGTEDALRNAKQGTRRGGGIPMFVEMFRTLQYIYITASLVNDPQEQFKTNAGSYGWASFQVSPLVLCTAYGY